MTTIEFSHRRFFIASKKRRALPASWNELPQRRRFFVFRALLRQDVGEALRLALRLDRRTWRLVGVEDRAALLAACPWLKAEPSASLVIGHWSLGGIRPTRFLFPDANFVNGSCMEFALADEYLSEYLAGNEKALPLLTATLLREPDRDEAAAMRREDLRVTLHGRMEIEHRAKRQQRLPQEVHIAALLYFIGVKQLVSRLYGEWLFEQPDEPEPGAAPQPVEGDPLGWWGLYMDASGGDVQKLDAIQQSNFHNFCTMQVRQRKQAKQGEMRSRMSAPDFGQS